MTEMITGIGKNILIFMAILIITTMLFNILVVKADSLIDLIYLRIALKVEEKKSQEMLNLLGKHYREEREESNQSPYHQEPYLLPYIQDYEWGNI